MVRISTSQSQRASPIPHPRIQGFIRPHPARPASAGTAGTNTSPAHPFPAIASGSVRRSPGMAVPAPIHPQAFPRIGLVRRAPLRARDRSRSDCPNLPAHSTQAAAAPPRPPRQPAPRVSVSTLRNGFSPVAKQISDLNTLPTPASTRCRSSASPSSISPHASSRSTAAARIEIPAQHIARLRRNPLLPRQRLRRMHLRHRHVESHRHKIAGLDHDAHVRSRHLPPLARPIDMPAPVHQHVGRQEWRPRRNASAATSRAPPRAQSSAPSAACCPGSA